MSSSKARLFAYTYYYFSYPRGDRLLRAAWRCKVG